jgi:hypothetical protein
MLMRRFRFPLVFTLWIAVLVPASGLIGQGPATGMVVYDDVTVLPAEGTLDQRPFFSTRRHPAISYPDRPSTDVVGELAHKVEDGVVRLRFDATSGYLLSILEALRVPVESQMVVFSKTSLQSHYISPTNPRAIFFSDEASVAFIRNAPLLEVSALDPRQGVVFYAIEQRQADRPRIARSDSCLSCHESRNTLDVPGLLVRSMGVGSGGQTMPQLGNYVSDHRSPFEERWGGWFITGKTASVRHMGNATFAEGARSGKPGVLASLDGKFDLDGYPSRHSDIAAVMVLNHQARMTNMLTRVGWETRLALDWQEKNPKDNAAASRLIAANAQELVDYMLFIDEPPLPGKFESSSGFPEKFAAGGPRDKSGRSLRQLDLVKRLLRYPCSYMIYSPAFDELPPPVRDAVYARLWDVLSGKDRAKKYSKLSSADRAAITGILLETRTGLPAYFKPLGK